MRPAAILLLLAACQPEPDEAPAERARLVETARVLRDTAVDRLVLLGDVHGEVEVRVFAEMPERIQTLHVTEGAPVSAGDPIATLAAGLPASEVAQASAAVLAAEASRDRLQSDIARIRPLVAAQAMPRANLESLEAQLRAAEAQVTQLQAGRRAAGLRRARTVVRAPTDGVVAGLAVTEGDMVAPSVPLCAVVQMDRVELRVRVVEEDYVRLREGMRATVRPASLDLELPGVVTTVAPVIDRLTRTALVEIGVANEDHRLRPGMVAEVDLELERRPDVVLAPSRAVLMTTRTDEDRSAAVFVRDGERVRRVPVQLGRRYPAEGESRVEITRGLEGGEEVVVQGQHLLRDGALVRVESPARARSDEPNEQHERGRSEASEGEARGS